MTKQEFWNSVEQLMPGLEELISGKAKDYTSYNALSDNGYRQGIPFVELLTEDIRTFSNWKIVKYRQRGSMDYIPVNEQKVYWKNILLAWEKMPGDQYKLTFYLKWHLNNQSHQTGAILHLDHTIGELDAMTRINAVEFKKLKPFQSTKGLKTLNDLKIEIDQSQETSPNSLLRSKEALRNLLFKRYFSHK